MLVARRLAELRQLTRQLQRVSRQTAELAPRARGARRQAESSVEVASRTPGAAAVLSASHTRRAATLGHGGPDPSLTLARLQTAREKILFRRAPICVSLLERSFSSLHGQMIRTARSTRHEQPHEKADAGVQGPLKGGSPLAGTASTEEGTEDTALLSSLALVAAVGEEDDVIDLASTKPGQQQTDDAVALSSKPLSAKDLTQHATYAQLAAEAMNLIYVLEQERRVLLQEKQRFGGKRLQEAEGALAAFRREFGLRGGKPRGGGRTVKKDELTSRDAELLAETETALMSRLRIAREDAELLSRSLLNRPLLSAKLWRLLLAERVWLGAVQTQRQASGTTSATTASRHQESPKQPHFLLYVSLLFARLVVGVTKDYVEGGDVPKHAPRFVVSLPSHAFRREKKGQDSVPSLEQSTSPVQSDSVMPTAGPEANLNEDADGTMLALMFGETPQSADSPSPGGSQVAASHATASLAVQQAPPKVRTASLRWVPPHSAHVIPLMHDTLAMFSFVLPELEIDALVRAGYVEEVADLLTLLQKLATVTLVLTQGRPGSTAEAQRLHETLQRLEKEMLQAGRQLMEACAGALEEEEEASGQPRRAGLFSALPPAKAARLAVELDALRLLDASRDDSGAALVLEALVVAVFPELKTNTQKRLLEKSRQSSLLAFATKGHRAKVLKQHGGPAGAEKYLLGTVIQRARLEQRKMAAAIREQRLTSTHLQSVTALGRAVPCYDLITLLRLLATTVVAMPTSPGDVRTSERGGWMGHQSSRLLTGALFVAEAILVSGSLETNGGGSMATASGLVNMDDMVQFWSTLATLWPVINTRRELQLQERKLVGSPPTFAGGHRSHNRGGATSTADVKTETAIVTFAMESVLISINGRLAEHVSSVHAAEQNADASERVSAEQLATLALGCLAWHESHAAPTNRHHGPWGVDQQVQLAQKLARTVVLEDVAMWQEIRTWPLEKRDAFARRMLECFRTADLLDGATARAVEQACSKM